MSHPYYRISVKADGMGYILFNEASGAICGDRLYKGETPSPWPFKRGIRWWEYDEEADANRAAKRLQAYLDGKPSGKSSADVKKDRLRYA